MGNFKDRKAVALPCLQFPPPCLHKLQSIPAKNTYILYSHPHLSLWVIKYFYKFKRGNQPSNLKLYNTVLYFFYKTFFQNLILKQTYVEDSGVLRCYAVTTGKQFATFWSIIVSPSSRAQMKATWSFKCLEHFTSQQILTSLKPWIFINTSVRTSYLKLVLLIQSLLYSTCVYNNSQLWRMYKALHHLPKNLQAIFNYIQQNCIKNNWYCSR